VNSRWPADDDWSADDAADFTPPPDLRADRLSPDQKRRAWIFIKQHEPELRVFLADPDVQGLVTRLNAAAPGSCSPVLPWHVLEASLSYEECRELALSPEPVRASFPEMADPSPSRAAAPTERPSASSLRIARDEYVRSLKRA
jgi:hypothetical protein